MKFPSAHQIWIALSILIMTHCGTLASEPDADYILGPGDALSIKDDNGTVTTAPVLPNGTAVVNYAGVIDAAGLTIHRINELVNEAAKKWFASPHIEITLDRRRLEQVYVLGAVAHPGLYSAKEKPDESKNTNAKSKESFTISTVLGMAGGLKKTADMRHLHVTRLHPKSVIDVDLWALMNGGELKEDLVLEWGDVIYVPAEGTEFGITKAGQIKPVANKIRVMGAVMKPGLIEIPKNGIDLQTVIARAGGLSDSASSIMVAHTAEDGHVVTEHVVWNRKENGLKRRLEPGDVVVVKQKPSSDYKISPSTFKPGEYGSALRKHVFHSPAQIEERSKHYSADIDKLWLNAQHLHHGATTKSQIEATYTEFETSLQKAADELDTGEPLKAAWATELIAYYTRPHHKWPAVSPTLDLVLQAREKLVQLTSEQAVERVEQNLYRFANQKDNSKYYSSPDLRPPSLRRRGY